VSPESDRLDSVLDSPCNTHFITPPQFRNILPVE
jgi:hypothetical protein